MRTTTVVSPWMGLAYPLLDPIGVQNAQNAHLVQLQSALGVVATAHGTTSDNIVSQSDGPERITVRTWPDLAAAQAWVDTVLSGTFAEGLEHPVVIVSAQVDPE